MRVGMRSPIPAGDWFDEVKGRGVAAVAEAFGLELGPNRSIPCPACGADRRGRSDRRFPAGLRRDEQGWRCHRCNASGDAITLAAWLVTGSANPGDRWADVRRACAERGLCTRDPRDGGHPVPLRPLPPPRPPAPPKRPPAAEVAALWDACLPVTEDPEVAAWIASRGLDPGDVEDRDLARALPEGYPCPPWAGARGASWAESGHRLIVPMRAPGGAMESLHARRVRGGEGPKGLSPAGASVGGLVMADPLGIRMLSRDPEGAAMVRRVGLVVAEGVPDFLTWGTRWSDAREDAPAVVGVISGSWSEALARLVPDGAKVAIRTDPDEAGQRYEAEIAATLLGRCHVRRRRREGR